MKLHVLRCGSILVPPEMALGGKNDANSVARWLLAPDRRRVRLPVLAFLLEHPKGPVLVDTGWCRAISPNGVYDDAAVRRVLPAHLAALFRPTLPAGEAIDEHLAALGIRPQDLACVVLTHLDADHVAGLCHLREAPRIVVAEDEYFWSCRTVYRLRQPVSLWQDLPLERLYYRGSPLGPNRWAIDLFGDESVMLVNVPGHTDGQAAVLIHNGSRFVLLASDAAFSPRNWETLVPPGFGFSAGLQRKSLQWIAETAADPACRGVFCSHDPALSQGILSF